MSFPSLNKTSDYDVYTNQYLQSLALQIQLNQNNFDKNVAYMRTGVQDTERPDSRSIEERAADVEKLKVQARVMLNKISDATNTTEVLDYLTKNGELLFFFIQQFPAIEKLVKEQYVGGIRAPILISMIYKRFISQQEDSLMPESEDFDIVSKVLTVEDATVILNETNNDQLKSEIQNAVSELLPQSELKKLTDDPVRYKDELKFVAQILKNSPNVDDYNNLIDEYNDASIKDDINNYDLENAEQNMINKLSSYLVERGKFIQLPESIETAQKIQKSTKLRTTKSLPKSENTKVIQTSERERALKRGRKKTIEDIASSTQINLKPVGERVIKPSKPNVFSELKTTPTLKPANTKIAKVPLSDQLEQEKLAQKVEQESQQRNKAFAELSSSQRRLKPTTTKISPPSPAEQMKIDEAIKEKEEVASLISKFYKKKQTNPMVEDEVKVKELKRISDEMEKLKRERDDIKLKEEQKQKQLDKVKAFQEKLAKRKISTFVKKQLDKGKNEISKLEDEIIELENLDDDVILKQESIKAKKDELDIKKKAGRPKGAKDINPRIRTPKSVKQAERIPEAPTNPPILIPRAPTNTPEIVPIPIGKGLLNKQEQLTHRFKVLKGEILAGNTASEVVKEMKSLVKKLVKSGELSLEQQSGILKELKTL